MIPRNPGFHQELSVRNYLLDITVEMLSQLKAVQLLIRTLHIKALLRLYYGSIKFMLRLY